MTGSDAIATLADDLGYDPEEWAGSASEWLAHYLAVGLDRLTTGHYSDGPGERKAEKVLRTVERLADERAGAIVRHVDFRKALETVAEMLRTLSSEANEAHDSEDRRRSGLHAGIGYIIATCETADHAPATVASRGLDGFRGTVRLVGLGYPETGADPTDPATVAALRAAADMLEGGDER